MQWQKLGHIFCPENNYDWMRTHASNPSVEARGNDIFRIYFSTRDGDNRSSIGWAEIDINRPTEVLRISDKPVIGPGEIGTFDDSGTSMACLVNVGSKRYLYYLGWNLGVTVPWRNSIGLAISEGPDEPFVRHSLAPLLDRNDVDPYSISYPWVMHDQDLWRMWYGSNLSWGKEQKDMAHLIKYAESTDALHWKRDGIIALNFKDSTEYAMSKPCVIKENNLYRMWYSFRGVAYRIGYAESENGVHWIRKDSESGITVSESGWDSETVEYPCVFISSGKKYMVYNGNGYGRTGFGIAVLENKGE